MSRRLREDWADEPERQVTGLQGLCHQNYTSVFKQGIVVRKLIQQAYVFTCMNNDIHWLYSSKVFFVVVAFMFTKFSAHKTEFLDFV